MKSMRIIIGVLLSLMLITPVNVNSVKAASNVTIYIDGKKQTFSHLAVIQNGNTLVPLRGIFESLGATVTWNGSQQTIDAQKNGTRIWLKIGSKSAKVDGFNLAISTPPIIQNGNTLVPLRFISESLGADVAYNSQTKTISIQNDDASEQTPINPTTPSASLSTSEIAKLNNMKVVMIEVGVADGVSQGSGVIVGNGLILTNAHVIDGMIEGIVYLDNGEEYGIDGVVAYDAVKDLALIKTTAKMANVSPVKIGSYNNLEKGDKIVAIGSPLGLQNTVSEGIVSSFRTFDDVKHIQISVPIDHGSSGGGLFNTKGELIGITTSGLESAADLNFAVAIDEALEWKSYFTTPFDSLKVIPVQYEEDYGQNDSSSGGYYGEPIFGDVALGMTKQEVESLADGYLYEETADALIFDGEFVYGYDAEVVYEFYNNRLVRIFIFHDVVNNNPDDNVLEDYFDEMYENIRYDFGAEVYYDDDWYNDDDGYSWEASWDRGDAEVYLLVKVLEDATAYGAIVISEYE